LAQGGEEGLEDGVRRPGFSLQQKRPQLNEGKLSQLNWRELSAINKERMNIA
jgi:hypothetical protein